jgi:hypothetical protein
MSISQKKLGPELRLCFHCRDIYNGVAAITRFLHLTGKHMNFIIKNIGNSNCAFCQLIGSAIPINNFQELQEKNGLLHVVSLPSINLQVIKAINSIELIIRDTASFRHYGNLVSSPNPTFFYMT